MSQLPPDMITAAVAPGRRSESPSRPASEIAPAGSGIWWVVCHMMRMASSASASLTRTNRATPATIAATASGTGVRVATPSTNVSASGVLTGRRAANDSAWAGARSATTPTTSVCAPSR